MYWYVLVTLSLVGMNDVDIFHGNFCQGKYCNCCCDEF